MVDAKVQLKHVVDGIFESKSRKEIDDYLYGVSSSLTLKEDGSRELSIFTDHRLDFFKYLLGVEIQHCYQILSGKKIKRLKHNMNQGNFVFIRDYDPEHADVEDFCYKRVCRIYPSIIGWKLKLSDGKVISCLKLNMRYKKAFQKYRDWSVYEDVTFFMYERKSVENIEESYIKRMVGRMRCIARNKARNTISLSEKVVVSNSFFEQREKIYSVLKRSRWIKDEENLLLSETLSLYEQMTISIGDMYQCFDTEYKILKSMEERINEERDRDRIRNLRNDMRLCIG